MSDFFVTLWTATILCPWNFPGKEYWSGLPFPSPGDLPYPGIELVSPPLAGGLDFLQWSHQGSSFTTQKVCFLMLLFSHTAVSNSLWPHGLQHARLPCPLPSPRVCSNSCPLNWWCPPTISSCCPLLSLSIFRSIRVFASESALCIRLPKVLELQQQYESFQWVFRVDFL